MTTNLPPLLKGGAFFIDNSTYESIQACDRAAQYQIVFKRQLTGSANPLNFGGAIHAALDVRYRKGGSSLDSLSEQHAAFIKYMSEMPTDDWRTPELGIEVINGYARSYVFEDFDVMTDGKTPFVELPFAVPLGEVLLREPTQFSNMGVTIGSTICYKELAVAVTGQFHLLETAVIPLIWCGKIDLVIAHNGEIWLADHKTTSVFGDSYFEQYKISSQFMGYKWALETQLGIKVAGVLVNVLAVRKPTKTGKNCTYHRQYMRIEDFMVEEWRTNTVYQVSEFFSSYANGYFPQRTTSCRNKWQRNCQYLGVCTLPPDQREIYLTTGDFQDVTWSPLRED